MDRNFKQSNGTPSRPIRSCAKKMGPGELARTSTVSTRNTGDSSSRADPAAARSSAPLRTNCHPLGSTCCSTIRGSPPRCSMRACIPTVSNMRGTSQTRAPACCAARIASTICSCGAEANATTTSSTRCARSIRVRSVSGPRYESPCCTEGSTSGEESTVPTRSIPYSEDCFILRASCSVTGPLPTMTVGALAWCFARSQRCPHPSKFHVLRAVTPFGSRHFVHRRHITLHVLPACNASIVTVETALPSTNSLTNEPGNVF